MIESHTVQLAAGDAGGGLRALRALQHLDGPHTWLQVFGPAACDALQHPLRAAIDQLRSLFRQAVLTGCSTAGAVQTGTVVDASLVVTVSRFSRTRLQVVDVELDSAGAHASASAGSRLASALAAERGLQAVFVLADGLRTDGDALTEALAAQLPAGVVVSGGLAADNGRFQSTWVLGPNGIGSGRIVAVGLRGDRLTVQHGIGTGFAPLGPLRRITAARGSVLERLDDEPALQLYRRYLGPRADGLPGAALQFPLELLRDGEPPLVRTVLGIDEAAGAIRFAGAMPRDCMARLLRCSSEQLVEGAEHAASSALSGLSRPALVTVVSCIGRRQVLGPRIEDELEVVTEQLPAGSVLQGFYSFGEIVPAQAGSPARLHNQSLCVTALVEA